MCVIEKKDKIITAFVEELAEHGYLGVNTNTVVKKAGVSKGLLFHYYESKEKLFLHIAEGILNDLYKYFEEFDVSQIDFFEAIKKYTVEKSEFFHATPQYFRLISIVFYGLPAELESEVYAKKESIFNLIKAKLGVLLQKVDLRENVTVDEVVNLIFSILRIISEKYRSAAIEGNYPVSIVDDMIKEYYKYFDIILEGILNKRK